LKKAGLIGGMSWESALLYYELINKGISVRPKIHAEKTVELSLS